MPVSNAAPVKQAQPTPSIAAQIAARHRQLLRPLRKPRKHLPAIVDALNDLAAEKVTMVDTFIVNLKLKETHPTIKISLNQIGNILGISGLKLIGINVSREFGAVRKLPQEGITPEYLQSIDLMDEDGNYKEE